MILIELGNSIAYYVFGECYENEYVGNQDIIEATKLYKLAVNACFTI